MIETLGALLGSLTEREQARGLAVVGITVTVLYWSYLHLLPALTLSKIPKAGKDPGFLASLFGVGLADAKRDFKKNGLKILNEAYLKVSNKVSGRRGNSLLTRWYGRAA